MTAPKQLLFESHKAKVFMQTIQIHDCGWREIALPEASYPSAFKMSVQQKCGGLLWQDKLLISQEQYQWKWT